MVISFKTIELRNVCEDGELAIEYFGPEQASKFQNRLFDLMSAESIFEISWINFKQLEDSIWEFDINDTINIQFCCNQSKAPVNDTGLINWHKIFRIKIINITNV